MDDQWYSLRASGLRSIGLVEVISTTRPGQAQLATGFPFSLRRHVPVATPSDMITHLRIQRVGAIHASFAVDLHKRVHLIRLVEDCENLLLADN